MIVCFIEFGVRPEADHLRIQLLAELFEELKGFEGFHGKETFSDISKPDRLVTLSYWSDREALARWMRNRAHVRSIGIGKREVFTHYAIKIAEVEREVDWTAPV